jgi:hypothetical protein
MTCRMCDGPDPEFMRNNISYAPSTLPHVDIQIGRAQEMRSSWAFQDVGTSYTAPEIGYEKGCQTASADEL